jgi:tetratricopeptide (TPR) repeat protein
LNNLAALYQRQERYGEAEPLFKRALAIREQALGRDHPDVGQSLNNLATLYDKLDRHADSEPLFKRALVVYEKAAGPEHPAVATLLNNLGQVARVQGRYAEAEPEILLVSHGAVDSQAATKLTIATFDRLKVDPKIGRAEALRQAMLSYLNDASIAQKCLSRFLGTVRPDR